MEATPAPPEVGRSVAIELLFLDGATCERCRGTGASIDAAMASLESVVRATGAEVRLSKIQVRSIEQARELRFVTSPTIRVNGRDIEPQALESECGPDACNCGPGAACRVWHYRGREYSAAPEGLIVDAVLSELYADAPRADGPLTPYELPDNAVRVLGGGGGRCCG